MISVAASNGPAATRTPAAERVLLAGIDLFFESGFLATTIRDVTSRCGLTPAAFYNHFESKESLLGTIVSEANAILEAQIDALELDDADPAGSLATLVQTLVTFNLTYPKQARIANREYVMLQPAQRKQVIDHRRRIRALFERVLSSEKTARGLVRPETHPAPDELEIRLLAISILNISISASDWFHAEGPLNIAEFAETHGRLAVRMAGLTPLRRTRRAPRRTAQS
jgi:AcrR family transcriptional regulator